MQLMPLEREVLEKLLAGEHPVLEALRRQLASISVVEREQTGSGFFTKLSTIPSAAAAQVQTSSLRFGDIEATMDGLSHGAGFVLYVDDGRLTMLEGYSYEEPWPEHVEKFSLRFSDPTRAAVLSQL